MISDKSKAIKKPTGEAYLSRLYKKHSHLIEEIRSLKEANKTADAEKTARNERLKTLVSSATVFFDNESACEESQTESEEM
jgi:hypothetical protein